MSSAPVASLLLVLTLATVLIISGLAKVRDPLATRDAFDALRVPRIVSPDAAATALPWVEIALGVALVAAPSGWLVPVAVTVVVLMLAYTGVVVRALGFDEPVSCSCFGSLGRHEIDHATAVRNVLLTVIALFAAWFAMGGGSAPHALQSLDGPGWSSLAAASAAVAVALLVVGRGETSTSSTSAGGGAPLDYERTTTPFGVLVGPDSSSTTLRELAERQARLLVILNPHCSPCDRTAAKLDEWAERLEPAVGIIAVYPHDDLQVVHDPALSFVEPELNVRRAFSERTPTAVVLGTDGLLAGGPVSGEHDVAEFVEHVLAELEAASSASG